ncbi:hypothetical protein MGP2080_00020 [marine gamma proteobacterium HTCC2080]|nr:hypothetical protein MGP2080_00020 [marine gamma proteobacterium HTCC2080]
MGKQGPTKDGGRLPLTRSLEARVLAGFISEEQRESHGEKTLSEIVLWNALANLEPDQTNLLDALAQDGYEAIDSDSAAILSWIDATFTCWEREVTLAHEAQQLANRLRPIAAAFALTDSRFFTPGAHGLHRLVDVFYDFLKGWHGGLGDTALYRLTTAADILDRIRHDFPSEPKVDEARIFFEQEVGEHHAQLAKLDTLLLERESANLGADAIRQAAAWLLNTEITQVELPESVAQFIASDWYESGVCIAQEHGFDSTQWRTFTDTTQLLVDVVQPVSRTNSDELRRLHITMQQISITLSKQLVSLKNDAEAVASTVGLIEYAMLRNLRDEDLGLKQVDPISGNDGNTLPINASDLTALNLKPGNWFLMQTAEGAIRIRFVGSLINNYYLIFMDFLGNRALRKSLHECQQLINSGELRCLEAQDSFCLAMSSAIELCEAQSFKASSRPDSTPKTIDYGFSEDNQTDPTQNDSASLLQHEKIEAKGAEQWHPTVNKNQDQPSAFTDPPQENSTIVKLQIPMGTWLGFHDRDPPLMAKIVACDLEKNSYIFTNREGIKMRELTVPQLVALIDRDMIDILERRTNFRETISQLSQQQERIDRSPQ